MTEHTYFILSIAIFLSVYTLIIWDKFDRAVVALSGAMLVVLLRIINQEDAFAAIDWNTLCLLIGMMMMVMIMRRTGVFEYMAVKIVKLSKAEPVRLFIFITITTGMLSAFLDNVTTILLMLPICLSVTRDLKLNPVPFILSAVFGSNVGGTATLIGDPPNIMIGSRAGLDFIEFLVNDAVLCIPLLFITTFVFAFIFRKYLVAEDSLKQKVMLLNENECIKDQILLKKSLYVFAFVVLGFLLHGVLHYESSTIALTGAVVLLFISKESSEEILMEIEWKTIFFFIGLFVLVGSIEATGVISMLAKGVIDMTGGGSFPYHHCNLMGVCHRFRLYRQHPICCNHDSIDTGHGTNDFNGYNPIMVGAVIGGLSRRQWDGHWSQCKCCCHRYGRSRRIPHYLWTIF